MISIEQTVRDILEAQGIKNAQQMTAGELVFGANILAKAVRECLIERGVIDEPKKG